MKKVLIAILSIFIFIAGQSQITVKLGSALLQNPGTDIHLPVSVTGLNSATGGTGVTGIELHVAYSSTNLVYDTTLNFSTLTPGPQWFFGANGFEYSTNWLEPSGNKLNVPDNTVIFEIVVHYLGGATALTFDAARCLLFDSTFNIIPGVQYINSVITPTQGSVESKWNGTGSWNTVSNWSNGIPGDSTNAVIETGELTVLSSAVCKSITINQPAILNVSSDFSLTANSNYVNNGMFNLMSGQNGTGSLIVRGLVSGTGINNFNCYLPLGQGSSHDISAPVTGATAAVFNGNTTERYAEASSSWVQLLPSDNLERGQGYRIKGSSPGVYTFQGGFTTGDFVWNNLPYTGSGQSVYNGLNLLGNPYPSAIQWDKGNWSRSNLDYAVYVWNGYEYLSWNGTIGSLKDGIIPAMQGFLVKTTSAGATLTVPANSRIHSAQHFYKETGSVSNVLSMKLENTADTNHSDVTFVNILNGATAGFDGSYDAYKLFGDNLIPQIYTTGTDQSQLSINTQPDFTLVPVEYKAGNAGTYKITFGGVSSFNPDQPLFFEDKTTNTAVNIRNAGEFVFTSDGSPATGRFILHFQEVGITEHAETPFQTWIFENQIHIIPKSGTSLVEQLEIFTVTGQLLWATGNVELPVIIQTRPLSIGLYILRIRTNEGIFSQKLYVR